MFLNYLCFGRLTPDGRVEALAAPLEPGTFPLLPISVQFVAIVLGVFMQPLVMQMKGGDVSAVDFGFITTGWFIAALILAVIIFPGAYRPQDPSPQPRFVQFCVLFGAGIGWQAIFETLVK